MTNFDTNFWTDGAAKLVAIFDFVVDIACGCVLQYSINAFNDCS